MRKTALKYNGFSLTELIVVIGIIAVLLAILIPIVSSMRSQAAQAETISRMRTIGQGLSLHATANNGSLMALFSPTRRWPNLIGPLLNWTDPQAPHVQQYNQVHRMKEIRPARFDDLSAEMQSGQRPISNLGVFGLNNFLAGRGTAHTAWHLIHIDNPSDTPLLSAVSRNWGTHVEPDGIAPEAVGMGFSGPSHAGGPLPEADGQIIYLMADLSIQRRENFWPFNQPEPWRYFHPLRNNAESAAQAAPGF